MADEIAKLKELRDTGVITESQFQQATTSILEGPDAPSEVENETAVSPKVRIRSKALLGLLVAALVVAGGALSVGKFLKHDASDAKSFAASDPSCDELRGWYKDLPRDKSPEVARQYWEKCKLVPPPVRHFDMEPWAPEEMYASMLAELTGHKDASGADQFLSMGESLCKAADAGFARGDLMDSVLGEGSDPSFTPEMVDVVLTAGVTTLCPEHAKILTQAQSATSKKDRLELAAELDAKFREEFGAKWQPQSLEYVADMAEAICLHVKKTGDITAGALWIEALKVKPDDMETFAGALGTTLAAFCPDAIDDIEIE